MICRVGIYFLKADDISKWQKYIAECYQRVSISEDNQIGQVEPKKGKKKKRMEEHGHKY